jgi:phenylpropionate dioxygenase-like ring-hydroxylating dioxygenase large terminal subunit
MFKSLLNPSNYTDSHLFLKEKIELFPCLWNLVCLKSTHLPEVGSYFLTRVVDAELIVYRDKDNISCFSNICPHRGSPLVSAARGKLPRFSCPYHGIVFNAKGHFQSTGSASYFCSSEQKNCQLDNLSLKQYSVQVVGDFVFVSLNPKVSLDEQFEEEILNALMNINIDTRYASGTWEEAFNWKLNYENVNDGLHPMYVHPSTFGPLMNFSKDIYSASKSFANDDLNKLPFDTCAIKDLSISSLSGIVVSDRLNRNEPWWKTQIDTTIFYEERYVNIFLFPNTNLCSIGGTHFIRQRYNPSSVERFIYELDVFLPPLKKSFIAAPLLKRIFELECDVIAEDSDILSRLQNNLSQINNPETMLSHGDYEDRIMRLMMFYNKFFESGSLV